MSEAPAYFTDGQAYERSMGRWSRLVGDQFLDWLALPKGLRWLDVGCGNGAFTEAIIARTAPAGVSGVDPSEGQLAFARVRSGAKSAQFQTAVAQALPFPDDRFDAAVMALVISFVPDPLQAAREMARVVRPGGTVAAYMWDVPGGGLPMRPIYAVMDSMGVQVAALPGFDASRLDRMRTVWEQAGLAAIETRVIRIRVGFTSFDDFWESCAAHTGPISKTVAGLSQATRDELKTKLRRDLPAGPHGRIVYEAFANAVKGQVPA